MQIFGIIIAGAFGAIFGSYATLFAYRLPREESCFGRYFGQKSRCPKCHNKIRTRELIPLFNWLFTLGKCSKCKTKIPKTHLFIEIFSTIVTIISYLKYDFTEEFIIHSLISISLIILIVTDYTHKKFPYQILLFILFLGFANRVLLDQTMLNAVFNGAIGIIFATIFYQIFYKKTSGIFGSLEQSLDYSKFILIASICLNFQDFLLYYLTIMVIFSLMILLDISNISKRRFSIGFAIIIPFLSTLLN